MCKATVTSNGQITIPASVRTNLKVSAGDRIEFIDLGNGRYEISAITRDVKSLKDILKSKEAVTVEQMNQAISQAASK